jgi:hypothetical protein
MISTTMDNLLKYSLQAINLPYNLKANQEPINNPLEIDYLLDKIRRGEVGEGLETLKLNFTTRLQI